MKNVCNSTLVRLRGNNTAGGEAHFTRINKQRTLLSQLGKVGNSATYNIKVHTQGEYEVFLVHKIRNYRNMCFQLETQGSYVKSWLKDSRDRNFGTLIEGESAYWENFDLRETFKKDIIKSSLGRIKLKEGDSTLKLELIESSSDKERDWDNQLISIILKKC